LKPLSDLPARICRKLALVASDVDGTLTDNGGFTPAALAAMADLRAAGVSLVLVTGRSAGFGLTLNVYLPDPIAVIAENGGVLIEGGAVVWRHPRPEALVSGFREARTRFPATREGNDNFCRLSDFTLDMTTIDEDTLGRLQAFAAAAGLACTFSTVHFHLSDGQVDKGTALRALMQTRGIEPGGVITVGDSVNDAPLFDAAHFPHSCFVGEPATLARLPFAPTYAAEAMAGAGFRELVKTILLQRRSG